MAVVDHHAGRPDAHGIRKAQPTRFSTLPFSCGRYGQHLDADAEIKRHTLATQCSQGDAEIALG
jgi:hypothetical protein